MVIKDIHPVSSSRHNVAVLRHLHSLRRQTLDLVDWPLVRKVDFILHIVCVDRLMARIIVCRNLAPQLLDDGIKQAGGSAVRQIERFLVGRKFDAVGHLKRFVDNVDTPCAGAESVDWSW